MPEEQKPKNPLEVLLHSSQTVESYLEWNKDVKVTPEQIRDWKQNHSQCHDCDLWEKDTEFSSFTLGMVICKRCDRQY